MHIIANFQGGFNIQNFSDKNNKSKNTKNEEKAFPYARTLLQSTLSAKQKKIKSHYEPQRPKTQPFTASFTNKNHPI